MNDLRYEELPSNAQEVLKHLCTHGPIWDGDLVSKVGRNYLLDKKLASKIVMGKGWTPVKDAAGRMLEPKRQCREMEFGFQAATYFGASVYKASLHEGS
jgi:hypothetical protein